MRRLEEFYCDVRGGGCGCYFQTWLRDTEWGNITFECPSCKHHHFRFVDMGLITEDRHNERAGETKIVMGLLSTVRKTPWHDDSSYRRQQLEVYSFQKSNIKEELTDVTN